MLRFSFLVLLAAVIAWLADRPGAVRIDWMNKELETSLAAAAAALAILFLIFHGVLRALQLLVRVPGETKTYFSNRKQKRGYDALSKGLIALNAGDVNLARRHVDQARRILPSEPLTQFLEFQSAQIANDKERVTKILSEMSADSRTALLGLRGLHAQALANGDLEGAKSVAEQAFRTNSTLSWAAQSVLKSKASAGDWDHVIQILDTQKKTGNITASIADKMKAVAFTAKAQAIGSSDAKEAMHLSQAALKIDPSLVPAAIQLCQSATQLGKWRKAQASAIRCFGASPHVGLAEAYARLQISAAPIDRLKRIQDLRRQHDGGEEGAVAEARAALAARDFQAARDALAGYENNPRARVATLFSAIADAEGDHGLAREWLARAVIAPRDPQWTADGYVSEQWQPISPVTGDIGAFEWKVPLSQIGEASPIPVAPVPLNDKPVMVQSGLEHLPDDPGTDSN